MVIIFRVTLEKKAVHILYICTTVLMKPLVSFLNSHYSSGVTQTPWKPLFWLDAVAFVAVKQNRMFHLLWSSSGSLRGKPQDNPNSYFKHGNMKYAAHCEMCKLLFLSFCAWCVNWFASEKKKTFKCFLYKYFWMTSQSRSEIFFSSAVVALRLITWPLKRWD